MLRCRFNEVLFGITLRNAHFKKMELAGRYPFGETDLIQVYHTVSVCPTVNKHCYKEGRRMVTMEEDEKWGRSCLFNKSVTVNC